MHSGTMKTILFLSLLTASMAEAQSQGSATIRENGRAYTLNCSGVNDVITVRGNNNTITLTGTCENLVIYGNSNTINGVAAQKVWLKGNSNLITITQQLANPYFSNTGNNNRYTIGTLSSGNLTVKGDDGDRRDEDKRDGDKKGRDDKK